MSSSAAKRLTRRRPGARAAAGRPNRSVLKVKLHQIRALSVDRVGKVLGRASEGELSQIQAGLNEILGK